MNKPTNVPKENLTHTINLAENGKERSDYGVDSNQKKGEKSFRLWWRFESEKERRGELRIWWSIKQEK